MDGEIVASILRQGRALLERFGIPVDTAGGELSTVVLPAGTFSLLVLGIPIPVFEYLGDGHQAVQSTVMETLGGIARRTLHNGHRLGLHSFIRCFGTEVPCQALDWFPGFKKLTMNRPPVVLGAQLVTLYPFDGEEIASWPRGPDRLVECVSRIESALPGLFTDLDRVLERHARHRTTPAHTTGPAGTRPDAR